MRTDKIRGHLGSESIQTGLYRICIRKKEPEVSYGTTGGAIETNAF